MSYVELHCKTNFSFLEGASHADELVQRAAKLGYAALAVTDRNSLAGVVRAHGAAKEHQLKLIIGAEITPLDAPVVVLWATDRRSYGRLCRLITCGRRRALKGSCELTFADIEQHHHGLLAGVLPSDQALHFVDTRRATIRNSNFEIRNNIQLPNSKAIRPVVNAVGSVGSMVTRYRELFGDRAYLLAELHRGTDDAAKLQRLLALSTATGLPLAAAQNAHYHVPGRMVLHDVLTAVRHGVTVAQAGQWRFPNAQRHLRSIEEIAAAFADAPQAIHRTKEIADRCHCSLDELRYEYPEELVPEGLTAAQHLAQLTWQGAAGRYPHGVPQKVRRLIEHELELIANLRYEPYFLTVWDLVRFARSRGILCQGRGSAANSAVCFCLGITSVDPQRIDVLFERFISQERNEAPDIDVDFEHERREEVLQYIYDKYGRERAGMTATVITYRTRSAVRDVGKALGLSLDRVDALAKTIDGHAEESRVVQRCRQAGIDPESETGKRFLYLVNELTGFPRHLSQHVGGMVITHGPLCELAPIENAAMEGRTVIEWDKDDLDELGILKVDCLSLGMLTAIRKGFELIHKHNGPKLTLANIPADDQQVYDMVCQADTVGVFQIESRGQMSMLPRLRPRCYYDLVIEVAIVRPGPIQGQMVHPYLRRRAGLEKVEYPNQAIRDVLHKTMGVPIFQEQAMRLAVVAAGFTPGEADQLRRAMGAWRRPGVIDSFRRKLLDGMRARGLSDDFAEQVFRQIRGFGEYGFPESHAASFALLAYVSAWLKHYYPAAFTAALINSQPMGFYAPAQLIRDARRHGVQVLPIDVNHSQWDCRIEQGKKRKEQKEHRTSNLQPPTSKFDLVLGLRLVTGLPRVAAEAMERARADGPFRGVEDFARRTGLSRSVLFRLAEADAFGSLHLGRRGAVWQALEQEREKQHRPLFEMLPPENPPPPRELPPLSEQEQVFADYQTSGFSLRNHPLAFYRSQLDAVDVVPAARLAYLANGRPVQVAGLVLLRQRPSTAKGITFVTLEDETDIANLVIRQAVWERYYLIARRSGAWIAHGKLEKKDRVIHVVIHHLEDLSQTLRDLKSSSRDFR